MTTTEDLFLKSARQTDTSMIPDCWQTPADVPSIQQMCDRLKNDWLFADQFFFPESNDWRNYAEGTFEPLYDYQGLICDTCENNDVVWIQASRGSAKSYTIARWVVSYCLRNPFQKAVIIAPSFRQSRMLYDYCAQIIKTNSQIDALIYKLESDISEDAMKRGHEVIMTFANGSSIQALPAGNGDTLRGTRATVLICDEFYLFPKEIYTQHIMPFLNVKKGEKNAKVIHLTTSWYQDCFAYSVLQDIATYIKQGRNGYAILDIDIEDVIYSERPIDADEPENVPNHFPAALPIILHQLETSRDKVNGKLNDDAMMTFYNKWIKSSAAWFRTDVIEECREQEVQVLSERPKNWTAPFVLGVDPAGMGDDSTQMCVGSLPGNDERHVHAIYKWQKISPEAIAGCIHQMVDKYGMYWIVMDKTGTLGADVAAKCAADKQLINGIWETRPPITVWDHPDAGKARAHIVLTKPSDDKIVQGFYGPRVDSIIGGEIDLKNALMRDMKSRLEGHKFKVPRMLKDSEYFVNDSPSIKGELIDNIREACGQLPRIDRETDRETKLPKTDGKGNYYFTRPPKDDGAFSMIYFNYGANILYKEMAPRPRDATIRWGSLERKREIPKETHMVVSPRLF